jgi:hypothetical protein
LFKKTKSKGMVVALMAAFFLTGSVVPVHAVDRDDKCERNIRRAESNLHNAVRKHGEHSRQAEKRRHELEEARERCHHDRR